MSNVSVDKHKLDVLATAISNKSGVPVTMTLAEMVDAVDNIQTGGGGGQPSMQTKTATYTPTTSQQTATITADTGYDGLDEVDITVNPIPSNYVDTSDANATQYSLLENTTAYVNGVKITGVIPQMTQYTGDMSQYFHTESNQRKWSVEGIIRTNYGGIVYPSASFGTGEYTYNAVPANTTITPTTSTQTVGGANWMMEDAVTVSAMPTGTAGTPTATKGSVSNHSISVTPSVTNATGYIIGSTKTGTAVTVSASELVSGSETKTANGTYDVTNLASLVVNVSGGSSWTKVAETSYQVSTSSTSSETVATWETGHSELWTNEKWVYVRIRDTAGKRSGYFYGSDNIFIVPALTSSSVATGARIIHRVSSSNAYADYGTAQTTGYGVYADTLYSDGRLRVRRRYSSNYSMTINSTYKVEVYLLDMPTGAPIFG